ncbi:alpha/beta hydrolase [Psychromonas sp. B3M02]|uniref:alpha/beta hydrolase n=1 Tax=Psychromonas sp. B3M02 TaxID=2267226 RepID=UPI001C690A2E|nr:alpha/beta fold hydrolase [Psychromonas sp. B3M02]
MISLFLRHAILSSVMLLTACSQANLNPNYQVADALPSFSQDTFKQYISETRAWLLTHRVFKTDDVEKELRANLPFELIPENPNGDAVLLVHGLGDSPYSFIDIADHLVSQGYLVRTVLLPGHGSKSGDLMLPNLADWQGVVHHHMELLKAKANKLWLGGYSTGANLVTSEALNDDGIAGLLLFSPAFKPEKSVVKWAGLASYFVTWADQDPETNYIRYNSLPMHGAAVYYDTAATVQEDLQGITYQKPVFMMMSEGDRVIDRAFPIAVFEQQFINPRNHLVWLGEQDLSTSQSTRFSMDRSDLNIVNGSHMGLLYSPDNIEYGQKANIIICNNGQSEEQQKACEAGKDIWFSSYGWHVEGKTLARLTYNPYFEQSMAELDRVMENK